MSHVSAHFDGNGNPADRRVHARQPVRSLAYVELGEGNGGIVLNVSEGGIAIQAVMSLMTDELPCVRLQLSHSKKKIEAKARVAWTSGLRKLAGVEFIDLSPEARGLLREWVALEAPAAQPVGESGEPNEKPAIPVAKVAPAAAPSPALAEPIEFVEEAVVPEPLPFPAKIPTRPPEPSPEPPPVSTREPLRKFAAPPAPPAFTAPPAAAKVAADSSPASDRTSRTNNPAHSVSRTSAERWPSMQTDPLPAEAQPETVEPPSGDPSSLPADRFGFRPVRPITMLPAPAELERHWKLPVLVGIFAVVSVAAGWFAGHGALHETAEKVMSGASAESVSTQGSDAPSAPAVSATLSNIEVIDSNNQHWLVPIRSPIEPSRAPAGRPSESASTRNQESRLNLGVELSAPVPSQNNANPTSQRTGPPPVALSSGAPENVLPPAADEDSGPASLPPPVVFPSASGVDSPNQQSSIQSGELVHRVEPVYPPDALAQRIEGIVTLYAVIDPSGAVKSVQPLTGRSELVPAAVAAVRQWRYTPSLLSGRPIQTERQITIVFRLSN